MDKIDIRGKFNGTNEWEEYNLGGIELRRRKKLSAQQVEDAAWEIAQNALIVDEEAGIATERLDVENILLWVLFKYTTNVDMEVFGDIHTGLFEFADALPDGVRFDFVNKYCEVKNSYEKIRGVIFEKISQKNDLGRRVLKAFGGFLGGGSFSEEIMKAKNISETLIDLMEKAKGYDNITGALKTKKTMPLMPEGVAKRVFE